VVQRFHVSVYKVDPRLDSRARNLLSKDDWRAALADEPVPRRPQVPLVIKPSSFACRGERLARTGTGPNRSIVGPAGVAKGIGPDADAGEEMALVVGSQVIRSDILNAPFVDVARSDVSGGHQVAQPLRGVWVVLVVVRRHVILNQ
jgi:hypothetical protein